MKVFIVGICAVLCLQSAVAAFDEKDLNDYSRIFLRNVLGTLENCKSENVQKTSKNISSHLESHVNELQQRFQQLHLTSGK